MEQQVTTINRGWTIKMVLYMAAMIALGIWGLVDGVWIYPKRGNESAEYREKEYLEQSQKAGRLLTASVADPAGERSRLLQSEKLLRQEAEKSQGQQSIEAGAEIARLEWLTALSRVGRLSATHTQFADPAKRLGDLQTAWQAKNPPKPLSAYDIPAQWVICAGGMGAGLWIVSLMVRVRSKKYRFDPEAFRLTLPDGRSIVPADIKEMDKRKWDKWYVSLLLKQGGEPVQLDLLRYTPLEAWVLEMEKKTDSYVPPPDAAPSANDEATKTESQAPTKA